MNAMSSRKAASLNLFVASSSKQSGVLQKSFMHIWCAVKTSFMHRFS
jgi:hypothetical protein